MTTTTSPTPRARTRRVVKDAVGAAAVDLARAAAQDVALPGQVGEHLGSAADQRAGERVVVHHFACTAPGYRGWVWSVTLARAPRAKVPTVSEALLLPDDQAVVAPEWLPWSQRLRPGDVGRTDTLPRVHDDARLVQGYESLDVGGLSGDGEPSGRGGDDAEHADDADASALWELGTGRARVLGPEGRRDAAMRWYGGASGPVTGKGAESVSPCATCGFFVPLAGALRAVFGVCANDWSPDDGRVVARDHGCGAHSESDVVVEPEPLPAPLLDDDAVEAVTLDRPPRRPAGASPEQVAEAASESVGETVPDAVADAVPPVDPTG